MPGQPDQVVPQTTGGAFTATAATAVGTLVAYTGAGRLCKVVVTTSGTGTITIRDSIVSASGTIIWASAAAFGLANAPTLIDMPFLLGLYIEGTAGSSAITISYNKSGSGGGA